MRKLVDTARHAFDAGDRGLQALPTFVRAIACAVAVYALVWLLQPDLFGLVPNSLDPMFYTGYAVNLDDALAAAGNRHYFVTRWTSYMPMYVFSEIFGPYWGRLILRLGMIIALSEMLWRFGHRLHFSTQSRLIGIFSVITAPMFVRAFTTDYPEYFIIWASIMLILLVVSFSDKPNFLTAAFTGVLTVSLLIANPTAAFITSFALFAGFVLSKIKGSRWSSLMLYAGVAGVSAIAVVVIGYLQFKYRYRIGNVYQPTIDFVSTFKKPSVDGWSAPTNSWLSYFSWIYISPVIIGATFVLFRKTIRENKNVLTVALIAFLTFAIHVVLEIRSGHALETSFYWSMSLGPVLILLFLLAGRFARLTNKVMAIITVIALLVLIGWRVPQQIRIPSGLAMFATFVIVIAIVAFSVYKVPRISLSLFLSGVLWVQIGAPAYSIRTNGGDLNSPGYDNVYRSPKDESHAIEKEMLWFLDQMDEIQDDWKSTFLTAGGWSAAIVGTYIPHPFSKWIVPVSPEQLFSRNIETELRLGYRPLLVIYGDPTEVKQSYGRAKEVLLYSTTLKDVTNNTGLGYRLIVMRSNSLSKGSIRYQLTQFDRQIGSAQDDGSVKVKSGTFNGFVSFGPYVGLPRGSYKATLTFTSAQSDYLGQFEVYNDVTGAIIAHDIENDEGSLQDITVNFDVNKSDQTWQFRTLYEGNIDATFISITLTKVN